MKTLTYTRAAELARRASLAGGRISDLVVQDQARALELPSEEVVRRMAERLGVMEAAVAKGLRSTQRSSGSRLAPSA